MCNQVQLLF